MENYNIKNRIAVGITLFLVAFHVMYIAKVEAEVAVFSYKPTRCRPITLNENLDITPTGITSAGCQFNLDVRARGEWVSTGNYFDTPPYGWGGDDYYTINEVEGYLDLDTGLVDTTLEPRPSDYSFTCQQPNYAVDTTWLPAYVNLVAENPLEGTGTQIADGMSYTFTIDPIAPVGTTFDIPIRFNANCTMYRRDYNGELALWAVEPFTTKCQTRSQININPRTVTRNYTVTVGSAACTALPTALPTNIKTPTPTKTPAPTPTPEPLTAGLGWFKLKDASLHRQGVFRDIISPDMTVYDSDDTLDMYPLIGAAGVLTAESRTIDIGSNTELPSKKRWERHSFIDDNSFLNDLKAFIAFAESNKNVNIITDPSKIQSNSINIMKAPVLINNQNRIPNNASNYIFIVDGDLTFEDMPGNLDQFNQKDRSAAIMATGAINVNSDFVELNGIFIADTIDLGYDVPAGTLHPNPLKINGNIITAKPINNFKRKRTDDDTKPTLFIFFNTRMYMDLLPYLTVIVKEGAQIQ